MDSDGGARTPGASVAGEPSGAVAHDGTLASSAHAEAPPDPNVTLETLCGERYRILAKLGSGAFGEVYKARDTVLNRTVALKQIRIDRLSDSADAEEIRGRFLREAQVAAQLQHVNIVTIYDILSSPGLSLIVMEFVEGVTLDQRLRSEKTISLPETVGLLAQVADALHHAHEHKVVHRDIKPANILLSSSGVVKVTDFGIAKAETASNLTAVGNIVGTPSYMSPEQAKGGPLDGRSDLFSLGCILYRCVVGKNPFHANNLTGILLRIVSDDPAPVDYEKLGLPKELQSVLHRGLAKDPSRRFQTAAEFGKALRSLPSAASDRAAPKAPVVAEPPRANDSVADTLMKEARSTTQIRLQLVAFKEEKRRLGLAASPLLNFQNVTLSPEEAYILSRVDGTVTPNDIFSLSPLSEPDTARALLGFLRSGLIRFEDRAENPAPEPKAERTETKASQAGQHEAVRREVEELFEASRSQDDWRVLGVERGAGLAEIKRAFHEKAFRYHPDRYRGIDDENFQRKLAALFTRIGDAFSTLSASASSGAAGESRSTASGRFKEPTGNASATAGGKNDVPHWRDPQQARALFQQAQTAFDHEDYWLAIELCHKAVEIDGGKAEYHFLLGRSLSQNPKWRYDAAESLRKAAELDPSRADIMVALGEVYLVQGLHARARRAFDTARTVDPSCPIPE